MFLRVPALRRSARPIVEGGRIGAAVALEVPVDRRRGAAGAGERGDHRGHHERDEEPEHHEALAAAAQLDADEVADGGTGQGASTRHADSGASRPLTSTSPSGWASAGGEDSAR